ncbi:MAG: hypothetical protein WA373_09895 [Burkholderiales bacterium]
MRKEIRVSFRVPVEVRQENGRFIATCFLLDSRQEATSKHDAIENMANAIQLQMFSRFRDRAIDTFLHDHGLDAHDESSGIEGGPYVDVSIMLKADAQPA